MDDKQQFILENFELDGEEIRRKGGGILKGYVRPSGYRAVSVSRGREFTFSYLYHRMKFLLAHGFLPKIVDHRNGITDDNRIENLRGATDSTSQANRGKFGSVRSSQYKGVIKRNSKWLVRFRGMPIGSYLDEIEAALVYDQFALAYFGEYARVNFPNV